MRAGNAPLLVARDSDSQAGSQREAPRILAWPQASRNQRIHVDPNSSPPFARSERRMSEGAKE